MKKLFERVKTLKRKSVLACNHFIYKKLPFIVIRFRTSNSLLEYQIGSCTPILTPDIHISMKKAPRSFPLTNEQEPTILGLF